MSTPKPTEKSEEQRTVRGRPFAPGQSGNPGGRPKVAGALRDLCRANTDRAFDTILQLLDEKEEPRTRLAAAQTILAYGHGKPTQPEVPAAPADDRPAVSMTVEQFKAELAGIFGVPVPLQLPESSALLVE